MPRVHPPRPLNRRPRSSLRWPRPATTSSCSSPEHGTRPEDKLPGLSSASPTFRFSTTCLLPLLWEATAVPEATGGPWPATVGPAATAALRWVTSPVRMPAAMVVRAATGLRSARTAAMAAMAATWTAAAGVRPATAALAETGPLARPVAPATTAAMAATVVRVVYSRGSAVRAETPVVAASAVPEPWAATVAMAATAVTSSDRRVPPDRARSAAAPAPADWAVRAVRPPRRVPVESAPTATAPTGYPGRPEAAAPPAPPARPERRGSMGIDRRSQGL